MALILMCEEVIEPTASAVMCVKNDRICDIIFQFEICTFCSKWKVTFRKVIPTALKMNVKKSDKSYLILGMCEHQFGCILPHGGPSSR